MKYFWKRNENGLTANACMRVRLLRDCQMDQININQWNFQLHLIHICLAPTSLCSHEYQSWLWIYPVGFGKKQEIFVIRDSIEKTKKREKFDTNRTAMVMIECLNVFSTLRIHQHPELCASVCVCGCRCGRVCMRVYVNARFDNTSWNCRAFNSCVK